MVAGFKIKWNGERREEQKEKCMKTERTMQEQKLQQTAAGTTLGP